MCANSARPMRKPYSIPFINWSTYIINKFPELLHHYRRTESFSFHRLSYRLPTSLIRTQTLFRCITLIELYMRCVRTQSCLFSKNIQQHWDKGIGIDKLCNSIVNSHRLAILNVKLCTYASTFTERYIKYALNIYLLTLFRP